MLEILWELLNTPYLVTGNRASFDRQINYFLTTPTYNYENDRVQKILYILWKTCCIIVSSILKNHRLSVDCFRDLF